MGPVGAAWRDIYPGDSSWPTGFIHFKDLSSGGGASNYQGVQHVYAGDQNGDITETYWGSGNSLTNYPLANIGSQINHLSVEITSDGTNHVFTGLENGG